MTKQTANILLALFRTRPMWGVIPMRLSVAGFLLWYSGMLITLNPPHYFIAVILVLPAALLILGFLGRLVGVLFLGYLFWYLLSQAELAMRGGVVLAIMWFLVVSIFLFLTISGSGRHSVDHYLARQILKRHPSKKWELYVLAETPFTRWWE